MCGEKLEIRKKKVMSQGGVSIPGVGLDLLTFFS
jgi:hypothetical protein